LDEAIVDLLRSRDSLPTEIRIRDDKVFVAYDIAWGYDVGEEFAHVTTNISPGADGRSIDFFFTNDVERIVDPATGVVLFEAGKPLASGGRHRCPECRGQKRLPGMIKTTGMGKGMGSEYGPCPTCDGLGYIMDEAED
jgi:hypothetical protein